MKFSLVILATLTLATAQIDINNIEPIDLFAQIPIHLKAEAFHAGRIVGGQEAARGQFPYQVGLAIKVDDKVAFCGGSIISEKWILTAAHCAEVADSTITVYIGAHNITDNNESALQIEVPKESLIIHDKWSTTTLQNDIALLKLPENLEFNDRVQSVNLPTRTQADETFVDAVVTASGWGKDSDASQTVSPVLRYVEIPVIKPLVCNISFIGSIRDTHICTSSLGGKSPCNGDSGGPLVLTEKDGSKTLLGATSFGLSFSCEIGWPVVFTRISSFLDWINEISGITIRP